MSSEPQQQEQGATKETAAIIPPEDTTASQAYQQTLKDTIKKGVYEFEYIDGPKTGEKVILERKPLEVRMKS